MKKLLILPVLAALFTACTNDELVIDENKVQQTEEDAISFDAYLNRAVTRAGAVGNLTTSGGGGANLQDAGVGFGVFAYYANGDLYSENAIPDFMYNQQVEYKASNWTYSPLKYWPNEFGSSAVSMGVDRVTFFAYAPYVGVEPSTGLLTDYYDDKDDARSTKTGITALTRNGKAGDPYVRYVGAFEPAKCVDLCYGVAAEAFSSSVGAGDGANDIKAGEPFINVAKPEVASKLKFNFKHALAQLNVQVDADVDITDHNDGEVLEGNTRIWVRSITFDGVAQRGYLNLNNGIWYDVIDNTKISHASVTVHDGRRDGAEALAKDDYETPMGFNPALVQSVEYATTPGTSTTGAPIYETVTTTGITGVTSTLANLFSGSNPLLVIPANEQLKVTIVYDVETADPSLPSYLSDGKTKGSTVENRITKSIFLSGTTPLKLESDKKYNISLHLGMTSVKFDAEVADWTDPAVDADPTWLPENGGEVTAAGTNTESYTKASVTIAADATSFTFTVKGLDASEAVANTYDGVTGETSGSATDGKYVATASFSGANNTTKNKVGKATVVGGTSGKGVIYTITQEAHELGLSTTSASMDVDGVYARTTGYYDFVLKSTATGIDWSLATVTVKEGSTQLNPGSDYTWDSSSKTLTFTGAQPASSGSRTFEVTVKAGDAAAETIKVKITKS